ncbi:glycosyltransferase involved in cell wall biosynthesis [Humitalea rosea]|uniref:Glycosyltransferase involved in cell wall biosynthesis n=1 Tax=Humitalea rosea TaxID=990373 RepID=A0A2W7IJ97_9PROT|nr:glycosyltransferase family 4 protein [Humitalea rosea]PZW46768.1 glycosyltransferase involved in cell wall biosynthesis [Humitalea rosea]
MKILYSHRIRSRDGQSVHLEAMVAALRAAGHEVRVVGPAGFATTGLGEDSRMVALIRRLLPAWVGELAELAYALPASWRLDRAAAAFHPDVIYERANLFHFAGALVAWRRGLPLLLEVNAPLAQERARFGGLALRRIAAAGERFVWRRATRVLPVTAVLAKHIVAAGVPVSRIAVVPNGIDPRDFPPAPARPEGGEIVLGFIGFLRDWHGLDALLRGIAGWKGEPRMVLQIVGDGPARPGLERLAAELGIADRLRFTGLAARTAVPGLIAGFDIALQPAAVAYACPLKVLEYMAAGRAILAPDQANLRELLEHGSTGLLFDPRHPEAFWANVLLLARNAELRRGLGEAARAAILRRDLTWSGHARRVVALATEAMAAPGATRSAAWEPVE